MLRGCNVGSGQRPFSSVVGEIEWANIDKVWHDGMPEPDFICDGADLPFLDESADYVVLSHTAEHFGCGEAGGLIREAHRVLRVGGKLIVTVPDMRELAIGWLGGKIDTQIYLTCVYGAWMGHEEDRHKWGFDRDHLRKFISANGDWSLMMDDWQAVPGMDLARDWWILGVQCLK